MNKKWLSSEEIAQRIKWPVEYIPKLARQYGWKTRTTNGRPLWTRGARYEFYWPDVDKQGLSPHKRKRRAKPTHNLVRTATENTIDAAILTTIKIKAESIRRASGNPIVIATAEAILDDIAQHTAGPLDVLFVD